MRARERIDSAGLTYTTWVTFTSTLQAVAETKALAKAGAASAIIDIALAFLGLRSLTLKSIFLNHIVLAQTRQCISILSESKDTDATHLLQIQPSTFQNPLSQGLTLQISPLLLPSRSSPDEPLQCYPVSIPDPHTLSLESES